MREPQVCDNAQLVSAKRLPLTARLGCAGYEDSAEPTADTFTGECVQLMSWVVPLLSKVLFVDIAASCVEIGRASCRERVFVCV